MIRAVGAFLGFMKNLILACLIWRARNDGIAEQKAADTTATNRVQDAMLKAGADRPTGRDDLAKRMRDRRF